MSSGISSGQMFGAVLGAAVGFFFPPAGLLAAGLTQAGIVALGATLGMTVGGIIDPLPQQTIHQEGPRLGDLSVQTSEWGIPIRRLFGTYKLTGNIIWALDLQETKHVEESGEGKGGGGGTKTSTTWYSYTGSWAVGLCEGEIDEALKIWFDSVLVFDGTHYSGGLKFDNHTIYKGSLDQSIDWLMASDNEDTPAYRGLCYIVFDSIDLENYGNKLPKVSVELSKVASDEPFSNLWNCRIPSLTPTNYIWDELTQFGSTRVKNGKIDLRRHNFYSGTSGDPYEYRDHIIPFSGFYANGRSLMEDNRSANDYFSTEDDNDYYFRIVSGFYYMYKGDTPIGCGLRSYDDDPKPSYYQVASDGIGYFYVSDHTGATSINTIAKFGEVENPIWTAWGNSEILIRDDDNQFIDMFVGENEIYTFYKTERKIAVFSKLGIFLRDMSHSNYSFSHNPGSPQQSSYITSNKDGELFIWKWNNNRPSIHRITDNSQQYLGLFSTTTTPNVARSGIWYEDNRAYVWDPYIRTDEDGNYSRLQIFGRVLSGEQVTIGSICEVLFLRAGLSANEFDISEGIDLVDGYVIPNPMSTRAAITLLTSAYQYELIEADFKIKLRKRNPIPIGQSISDIINFVEIERRQTVELSRQINIGYANKNKGYDAGIQHAIRVDTDVKATKEYQFALSLTDSKAKQIAEMFLFSEWNERMQFSFSIPIKYIYLEPSNVITLVYKGSEYSVRLTKIDYATNGQLNCEASLENQEVYISDAEGSDTGAIEDAIVVQTDSKLELLDLPMLDNIYNQEGIYIASSGYNSGWMGCNIDKSTDGEVTYKSVDSIINPTIMGFSVSVLANGTTTTLDETNTVKVSTEKELYDISIEDLFNAKNYILIGDEILQYQYAQYDSVDNTYTLSNLLRGRRGTEWATGTHSFGERFVFLDTNMIFDSSATLNVNSYYKATTFGAFREDSTAEYIVPEIRCLKPLSVSMVYGTRDSNNNLTINWMRRSRDVTGYMKTLQLLEEVESYEIDIITGSGRTLTSSSESVIYTAEDQITDGATPGDPIIIEIYQMSGIVGRGYAFQETV